MKSDLKPETVVNEHSACSENPLYDESRGLLYWCDIPTGKIWALDVQSGVHRLVYQGAECGAFTLQKNGDLLLFPGHDVVLLNPQNGEATPVKSEIVSDTGRFNDCIALPDGGVFAGTVDWEQHTRGALFDLGLELKAQTICKGTACSNGMAFTPDLRGLYWSDSTANTVFLFDFDAPNGKVSNRRVWLETPELVPDGLTIDTEGNLWIAFYEGACVRHYNAQAHLLLQVDLPAPNITSCIFGGPDFGDLYITSAAQSDTTHPISGALFRIRPEVGGKAEFRSQIEIAS